MPMHLSKLAAAVVDDSTITNAWRLEDQFSLSWWNSLVVAAAIELGCGQLLTEDLKDGQRFDTVTVVNPFVHPPP